MKQDSLKNYMLEVYHPTGDEDIKEDILHGAQIVIGATMWSNVVVKEETDLQSWVSYRPLWPSTRVNYFKNGGKNMLHRVIEHRYRTING